MRTLHFGPSTFFFQPHLPERDRNTRRPEPSVRPPATLTRAQRRAAQDHRRRAGEQPPATAPLPPAPHPSVSGSPGQRTTGNSSPEHFCVIAQVRRRGKSGRGRFSRGTARPPVRQSLPKDGQGAAGQAAAGGAGSSLGNHSRTIYSLRLYQQPKNLFHKARGCPKSAC